VVAVLARAAQNIVVSLDEADEKAVAEHAAGHRVRNPPPSPPLQVKG